MRIQLLLILLAVSVAGAMDPKQFDYLILATTKTSTMEKEMNEAADAGYAFQAVMGGETAFAGNEVALVMAKSLGLQGSSGKSYKLLATNKTSTMQKELSAMGAEGYAYRGQTIFNSSFGGREVAVILERDSAAKGKSFAYRLLSTSKSSTLQKELRSVGEEGFELLGMTVAKTAFGGNELVCILGKEE